MGRKAYDDAGDAADDDFDNDCDDDDDVDVDDNENDDLDDGVVDAGERPRGDAGATSAVIHFMMIIALMMMSFCGIGLAYRCCELLALVVVIMVTTAT